MPEQDPFADSTYGAMAQRFLDCPSEPDLFGLRYDIVFLGLWLYWKVATFRPNRAKEMQKRGQDALAAFIVGCADLGWDVTVAKLAWYFDWKNGRRKERRFAKDYPDAAALIIGDDIEKISPVTYLG